MTTTQERGKAWMLVDTPADNPADDLTPAERRALFFVSRLCIGDGRVIAGVFVRRTANTRYVVAGVPMQRRTVADVQEAAALEVVRLAREVAA